MPRLCQGDHIGVAGRNLSWETVDRDRESSGEETVSEGTSEAAVVPESVNVGNQEASLGRQGSVGGPIPSKKIDRASVSYNGLGPDRQRPLEEEPGVQVDAGAAPVDVDVAPEETDSDYREPSENSGSDEVDSDYQEPTEEMISSMAAAVKASVEPREVGPGALGAIYAELLVYDPSSGSEGSVSSQHRKTFDSVAGTFFPGFRSARSPAEDTQSRSSATSENETVLGPREPRIVLKRLPAVVAAGFGFPATASDSSEGPVSARAVNEVRLPGPTARAAGEALSRATCQSRRDEGLGPVSRGSTRGLRREPRVQLERLKLPASLLQPSPSGSGESASPWSSPEQGLSPRGVRRLVRGQRRIPPEEGAGRPCLTPLSEGE